MLSLPSLSSQIEYIVGKRWVVEYNKWLVDFCSYSGSFKYHDMSKIKWSREIKKLPKNCSGYYNSISCNPNITWDVI